jgi:hypothetical protein
MPRQHRPCCASPFLSSAFQGAVSGMVQHSTQAIRDMLFSGRAGWHRCLRKISCGGGVDGTFSVQHARDTSPSRIAPQRHAGSVFTYGPQSTNESVRQGLPLLLPESRKVIKYRKRSSHHVTFFRDVLDYYLNWIRSTGPAGRSRFSLTRYPKAERDVPGVGGGTISTVPATRL